MIDKKNKPYKKNLTITLSPNYCQYLKNLSYQVSVEENRKVSLSELVSAALKKFYPMPQDEIELDFSDKKEEGCNA